MSKARLIYFAVFFVLIVVALLPALAFMTEGPHEGAGVLVLAAGCSSTTSSSQRGALERGSLEALWRNPGQSVSLIPGTSDYSPGLVRVSFLVVEASHHLDVPRQENSSHVQP